MIWPNCTVTNSHMYRLCGTRYRKGKNNNEMALEREKKILIRQCGVHRDGEYTLAGGHDADLAWVQSVRQRAQYVMPVACN